MKLINFTAIALLACTYLSCKKESPVQEIPDNAVAKTQLKEINACSSPPQFWGIRTAGGPNDDLGFGVAIDPSGIVSLLGSFRGTVDFNPEAGVKNLISVEWAYFKQHFDRNGKFVNAEIQSPASFGFKDKQGNTFDIVYEDGIMTENSSLNCGRASQNYLLAKTSSTGQVLWKSILLENNENPCNTDFGYKILTDKNGDLIVNSAGGWKKISPSGQTLPFNAPNTFYGNFGLDNQDNIYFQHHPTYPANKRFSKYDGRTGKELWYVDIPITAMDVDNLGNVLLTGTFSGTRDFNPGSGTYGLTASAPNTMFVMKLDANGRFHWAKKLGIGNPRTVKSDPSGKYVFVAGSFEGTQTYAPVTGNITLTSKGKTDAFIIALRQCQ